MMYRPSRKVVASTAAASTLVLLFAGCQVAPPNTANKPTESSLTQGGKTGTVKPGTPAAQDGTPDVAPDAKVAGQVLDMNGKPIEGVEIRTFHGFSAKTDAQGHYAFDVAAHEELRLDFQKEGYLQRQVVAGLAKGMDIKVEPVTLKSLDTKVTQINAAAGGKATNTDGSSILEVPAGALEGNGSVRLTWMDPMPSDQFPTSYGQLPGPLVTRTRPDGAAEGESLVLPPLGFTNVEWIGAKLKPGAQATLRMKVNPEAVKAAGDNIDWNNPATLQQPCYDYDAETGLWINPATSKLEKDANGDVWFVYTLRGKEAPKNYKPLSHISGEETRIAYRQESRTGSYQAWVDNPGGGGYWVTRYYTYTVTVAEPYIVKLYGQHFGGTVVEQSAYSGYNGRGIGGATVFHAGDFYGSTTKSTGGNGGFDIPMWHNSSGVGVYGSSWRGANSTGGGLNMTVPTDGTAKANIMGGSLQMVGQNSNITSEAWSGNVSKVAARDSQLTLQAPAAPLYLRNGSNAAPTLTGTVPVKGTLDFGLIKVVRDLTGKVIEQVTTSPDNAPSMLKAGTAVSIASDGAGLADTTISNFTDALTNATSIKTDGNGAFKFTVYGNATDPTVNGNYHTFVNQNDTSALNTTNGAVGAAQAQPYTIVLNTNSTFSINLKGVFAADNVGKPVTLRYQLDGATYEKTTTFPAVGSPITLTFARDTADDRLNFRLLGIDGQDITAIGLSANDATTLLVPGGTGSKDVEMRFKDGSVKYRH